jgi:hypothetical protein
VQSSIEVRLEGGDRAVEKFLILSRRKGDLVVPQASRQSPETPGFMFQATLHIAFGSAVRERDFPGLNLLPVFCSIQTSTAEATTIRDSSNFDDRDAD